VSGCLTPAVYQTCAGGPAYPDGPSRAWPSCRVYSGDPDGGGSPDADSFGLGEGVGVEVGVQNTLQGDSGGAARVVRVPRDRSVAAEAPAAEQVVDPLLLRPRLLRGSRPCTPAGSWANESSSTTWDERTHCSTSAWRTTPAATCCSTPSTDAGSADSRRCRSAAGGSSFAVSSGDRSFLVWIEVSGAHDPGTPTCFAAFDCADGAITQRRLLAHARPRNDAHTTPGIVRDGGGYLHVLTGAHNSAFQYMRSLEPLNGRAWSKPEGVMTGGYVRSGEKPPGATRQTYLSLACLPDDRLVIVFRQRRRGVDRVFGGRSYDALSCVVRAADGTWGEAKRLVFRRDRAGYVQYYQKLSVDRAGRLYLMLSCFHPHDWPLAKRDAHRYRHRMLLISRDGGRAWDFATSADFIEGIGLVDARE